MIIRGHEFPEFEIEPETEADLEAYLEECSPRWSRSEILQEILSCGIEDDSATTVAISSRFQQGNWEARSCSCEWIVPG